MLFDFVLLVVDHLRRHRRKLFSSSKLTERAAADECLVGVGAFLLQHALQGWCPPLPLLRQLGVRTAEEINEERTALKTIRGDFYDVSAHSLSTAAQVMGAVRR